MVKIIKNKKDKFTITNNTEIRDSNLSWKARGIFGYLWSQHDEWDFYETEVAKHAPDGRDSLRTGLKELEKFRYLKRTRTRNSKGVLGKTKWILSDKPMLDNPTQEKPTQENPTLSNTNRSNTNRRNTNRESYSNSKEKSGSDEHDLMMISNRAQQLFGTSVTPTDYQRLSDYHDDLSAKLMLKGFDIAENYHAHGIRYVFSIFTRWCSKGYHSLNDFNNSSKQKSNSSNQGRQSPNQPKSQDEVDKENEAQAAKDEERINKMMEGRK